MFAGGLLPWIRRPMSPWARLRSVVSTLLVWAILYKGARMLEEVTLKVYGGREKLWLFQKLEEHRYTAMAMLTGTLRLRSGLSKIGHDEQVYNGAGFTNWGFGVPLLQLPFHALAPKIPSFAQRFFPDRAIYFFYLALTVLILWAAFDRLLAMRERADARRLRRHVLSWTATGFVLVTMLYPLMASRFYIYEETLCYLIVFEFLALAAYIFALRSWSAAAVVGMGVAAGFGLLIRPTGLVYLGAWGALLLLERRRWQALLAFAVGVGPLFVFWLYSNWVRSGSPTAMGLSNSLPWWDYHTPMLRFGTVCADTVRHALEASARLFNSFFITVSDQPGPWMKKCHFDFEDKPPPPVGNGCYTREPFFGIAVFVLLAWMFLHQIVRRERRLALYLPHVMVCVLFAAYVRSASGFAWRYVGDFWPLILLACVQYVRFLPSAAVNRWFGLRLALVLGAAGYATYSRDVDAQIAMIEPLDEHTTQDAMWDDFSNSRYALDKSLPTHFDCGQVPDWPWHNGQGWLPGCKTDTFSNIYLGVPSKSEDHYQLQFKTEGFTAPTLRVYVNGRNYTARRNGDSYVADVEINFSRLSSAIVMTTIEWTNDPDPIPGRLLSIRLS